MTTLTIMIDHIEDSVEEIIGDKINIMIGMVGNIEIIHHHDLNIGIAQTTTNPFTSWRVYTTTKFSSNMGKTPRWRMSHKGLPQHSLPVKSLHCDFVVNISASLQLQHKSNNQTTRLLTTKMTTSGSDPHLRGYLGLRRLQAHRGQTLASQDPEDIANCLTSASRDYLSQPRPTSQGGLVTSCTSTLLESWTSSSSSSSVTESRQPQLMVGSLHQWRGEIATDISATST